MTQQNKIINGILIPNRFKKLIQILYLNKFWIKSRKKIKKI